MYLWYVVSFLPPPPLPVDLVALLTLTAFLTGELLVPLGGVEPPIMVMENGERERVSSKRADLLLSFAVISVPHHKSVAETEKSTSP